MWACSYVPLSGALAPMVAVATSERKDLGRQGGAEGWRSDSADRRSPCHFRPCPACPLAGSQASAAASGGPTTRVPRSSWAAITRATSKGTAPAGGSVRSCAGTPSSRNRLSNCPGVITPRITAPSLSTRNVCATPRGMYTVVPGPASTSRPSIQNVTSPASTMKTSSSRVCTWRGGLKPAGRVVRKIETAPPLASAGTRNSNRLLPYQTGSDRSLTWGVGASMLVCMSATLRSTRPKVKQRLPCDSPRRVVSRHGQRRGDERARQRRLFAGAPSHGHPRGLDALERYRSQLREGDADRADRRLALARDRQAGEHRRERLLEGVHARTRPQRLVAELLERPERARLRVRALHVDPRLTDDVLGPHALVVGEPVVLAHDDVARLGQKSLHRHHSIVGERRAHEADVDDPGPQTGGRIDHAVIADLEVDVLAILAEAAQRLAHHRDHGGRSEADPQRRAGRAPRRLQFAEACVERGEHRPRVRQQPLARLRQRNAARRAIEQTLAHPRLELPDLRGQRLLGEVQALRGAGEVELLGHRHEGPQQPTIEVGHRYRTSLHSMNRTVTRIERRPLVVLKPWLRAVRRLRRRSARRAKGRSRSGARTADLSMALLVVRSGREPATSPER